MKINHGIIAVDAETMTSILHFCGYENPPTQYDWNHLEEELDNDPDFNLGCDYVLMKASDEIVKYFVEEFLQNDS